MRTLIMLRLSAAAARMIDTSCATNSLRRTLPSSVHPDFKRTVALLIRRPKFACHPASVGQFQVLHHHLMYVFALRTFKGPQIGTGRGGFDPRHPSPIVAVTVRY